MNFGCGKIAFVMAAILALGFGWVCMVLAKRLRWVDRPGHRKSQKRSVPYLGGLALFLALGTTLFVLYQVGYFVAEPGFSIPSLLACLSPALAACGLGLWDDIYEMPARYKFAFQGLIALGFSQFAYRFSVFHIPGFSPLILDPEVAVLVTTFFMVAVVNGFNMIDGSDALCLGSSTVTLALVSAVAELDGQPQFAILGLATCGACLGLLYWNRPPARIYIGDAGSLGLGFLVAGLVVALGAGAPGHFLLGPKGLPREAFAYQIVVASLLVGIPALEVLLTVARRGLQGRSLGRGDQGHLHHRLAQRGWRPASIAGGAMGVNLLCGSIALAFLSGEKGMAVMCAFMLAILLGLGLQYLDYFRMLRSDWLDKRRPHYAVATHFAAMQASKLKLASHREEVLALVKQACHEFGAHECRVSVRDSSDRRWIWKWSEPAPAQAGPRVKDRVRIADTRNHASWTMENDDREPDLNMNLRVIMTEFMRDALERLVELMAGQENVVPERDAGKTDTLDLVLSIKGFKNRL